MPLSAALAKRPQFVCALRRAGAAAMLVADPERRLRLLTVRPRAPCAPACVCAAAQSTQNGGSSWVYETPNMLVGTGADARVTMLASVPTSY